jgi:hypothetical protein
MPRFQSARGRYVVVWSESNLEHAEWRLTRVGRVRQQSRDTPAQSQSDGCEVVLEAVK